MKASVVKQLIDIQDRIYSEGIVSIYTIREELRYVLKHNQMQLKSSAKTVKSPSELTFYYRSAEYTLDSLIDHCKKAYKHKVKVGLQQLLACGIHHKEVEEILEEYISNIFYERTI